MPLKVNAELRYSNAKFRLALESLSLEGDWRVSAYTGRFRLARDGVEIKVTMGSLVRGIAGGARREGLEGSLELLAKLLGKRVVLKGPLGIKLAEARP
jgi:hypothetical protein